MRNKIFLACLIALSITACYEEEDVVGELITPTGKGFYPVSANTFTDLTNGGTISNNRTYTGGTNISFELIYWSSDLVKEVNFYKTVGIDAKELILTTPYSELNFSKIKSADTLILNYQLPVVASLTTIKLEMEIVNENTLALTRALTIKSKP